MSTPIRTILPLCLLLICPISSGAPSTERAAEELLIVHCLLPGQVRQLGSRTTYVSPRRGAKITAAECELRGGEYVREDSAEITRALAIWLPAAREGDPDAQINVGMIFERGFGRAPDYAEAAVWYQKAAEGGSVRAQLKLSELYETGRGVPVDLQEALRWYQLAMGKKDGEGAAVTENATVVVAALDQRNTELVAEVEAISGELSRLAAENERLKAAIAAGTRQAAELQGENAEVTGEIGRLQGELDARQRQIDALSAQLAESRNRLALEVEAIRTRDSELVGQQSVSASQQSDLAAKDATIGELESELAGISEVLAAEQATVTALTTRLENLEIGTRGVQSLKAQAMEQVAFAPPVLTLIDPKVATTRGLVKVSAPAPGSNARVVGRVQAAAGLFSLTVDGAPIAPNPAGMFMSDLERAAGRSINIVAVDNAGQVAEMSFDYRSTAKPALVPESQSGWENLDYGRYRALVIGNNQYQHLPALQTARADAAEVARVLRSRYGFDVTLLENATRFQILSALNELRESLTSRDNLVIYYAGHGELDRVNMRGYWLPVDADRTNTANWVSSVSITDILNAMSARHVLLLADSCYSGALTRSALSSLAVGRTDQEVLSWTRTMLAKRSRQALTSGGLQPVLDSGGGRHSIFAGALISALESNEAILEGRDLFEAVAARVAFRSANLSFDQVPEFAPIRHAGHEAGAFFFRPL